MEIHVLAVSCSPKTVVQPVPTNVGCFAQQSMFSAGDGLFCCQLPTFQMYRHPFHKPRRAQRRTKLVHDLDKSGDGVTMVFEAYFDERAPRANTSEHARLAPDFGQNPL